MLAARSVLAAGSRLPSLLSGVLPEAAAQLQPQAAAALSIHAGHATQPTSLTRWYYSDAGSGSAALALPWPLPNHEGASVSSGEGASGAAPVAGGGLLSGVLARLRAALTDAMLMAVPKKKVSPHRRGMRNAGKPLKYVPMVSVCRKCGRVMHPMGIPSNCGEDPCPAFPTKPLRGRAKRAAEEEAAQAGDGEQPPPAAA